MYRILSFGYNVRQGPRGLTFLFRFPLHQAIHPLVANLAKAQPVVEAQGRIVPLHVDADGQLRLRRFVENVAQQGRPDSLAPILCQERYIYDPNLVLAAMEIEPPDRFAVEQNEVKVGVAKVLLVMGVLGVELHLQECFPLCISPIQDCHFRLAGAGVNLVQKAHILGVIGRKVAVTVGVSSRQIRLPDSSFSVIYHIVITFIMIAYF